MGDWGDSFFLWSLDSTGGSATGGWVADSTAVFSAGTNATGSFAVGVNGTQSVAGITFEEGNVGIGGGGGDLTLTGGDVSVAPGVNASISAPIGGSVGLNKEGTGTLTLSGANNYTGNTTISAGTLILSSIFTNSGVIRVEDGEVFQVGLPSMAGVVNGGHIQTVGSGVMNVSDTCTLQDVTLDAGSQMHFNSGSILDLQGTIVNNTTLAATGGTSDIGGLFGSVILSGTGKLTMSASGFSRIHGIGPAVITNEAQHTIQGSGTFSYASPLELINRGLVDANQPTALAIDLTINGAGESGDSAVNTGTMQASSGGTLYLGRGGTFTNTGGLIRRLRRLHGETRCLDDRRRHTFHNRQRCHPGGSRRGRSARRQA